MSRSYLFVFVIVFVVCVSFSGVLTQICEDSDSDEICVDHEQCCGGCCFDGECIDTARSCLQSLDVCASHACVGGQVCSAFLPPHCPGCEPVPLCVDDVL
ncbi:unnamed protein product [Plutella xylostella]|uniref:(diamondback moth) hypothetical protein n=1 Tax=Plutella xylostella TaxID=51655 RepID=A0A8S4D0G5_PLUXY|nr:unnamed protein product [Plutella xylostella]